MNPESIWIDAALAGDDEAFRCLVRRFERPVFTLCLRMLSVPEDAEDAAQETFVRAYRALAAYDRGRPFSTWLLSIAAHHCVDRLRRRRLSEVSLERVPPWRWLAAREPAPEEEALAATERDKIGAWLGRLSDEHRVVLVLRYWHDLGYAEIAELLGDTEPAVKSRLHRARRCMAALMAEGGDRGDARAPETWEGSWTAPQPTS